MEVVHETKYSWQKPVLTEKYACDLLKKHPISGAGIYLGAAWATVIDVLDFGSERDKLEARTWLENLLPLKTSLAFTVCQHDRFHILLPTFKRIGITTIFASHMVEGSGYTTKEFYYSGNDSRPNIDGIDINTIFLAPVFIGNPKLPKDLLYSFVGSYGKKHISNIRQKIFNDTHDVPSIVIERRGWQFDTDVYGDQILGNPASAVQKYINAQKSKFYEHTLSRSRFSLCPSGTGPASIRFLESLGSGAIPIILADTMMLPSIQDINWTECTIKLAEKDYNQLRKTLGQITPEEGEIMRKKGLEAYNLCTGKNFIRNIREYYDND